MSHYDFLDYLDWILFVGQPLRLCEAKPVQYLGSVSTRDQFLDMLFMPGLYVTRVTYNNQEEVNIGFFLPSEC